MNKTSIITGPDYRITVLTDRLVRLEYQKDGSFEDRMTKTVVNRDFKDLSCPDVTVYDGGKLTIDTPELHLEYDKMPFSSLGLSITLKATGKVWHYSIVYGNSDGNLLGTARTLDLTDGFTELEPGIFGRNGYAVLNDSNSPVCENGEYINTGIERKDLYFFGYGRDFYSGLKSFFTLCGKNPMIPRYALGNWWSRYCRYTEDSYRELLENFEKEHIPLSVAVIDMDWHLTDVDPKYGTGWTGYTWDKECFPDHKRFLKMLHDRKLAPTLNLHPADGIRAFEAMYRSVAKRAGIDPETEEPVKFDMSDPKFREAYFEEIIHPYEDDGVAFWWIDWQQGTGDAGKTDPLFLLNHYHYRDQEDRGKRPMIFSRYAGPGSHRYPVGFSGDTRSTWRSLAYQPYFTATAANIGYGWWSHDIGGHMLGDKDNERLTRWIQFGVFSPIMRIHSSNSLFFNKEPWTLPEPYRRIIGDFMRLRHRLVPYLYTESHMAYEQDVPMLQPLYYAYPDIREAYEVPNEYIFGRSLIVCAITEPGDRMLQMASVNAYIPAGRWYDIFTGHIYDSNGYKRKLYRPLTSLPVLLGEGSILPGSANDNGNGTDNPGSLRILFGAGKSGEYTLYEDDGISTGYKDGAFVTTRIGMEWNDTGSCILSIDAAKSGTGKADDGLIPAKRSYELCLYGVEPHGSLECAGADITGCIYDDKKHCLIITVPEKDVREDIRLTVNGLKKAGNDKKSETVELLDRAWTVMEYKEKVFNELITAGKDNDEAFLCRLDGLDVPELLKDAIREIFA
ncbi:MAG: glycoside hydrolase family 31 protein [Lachnospiraceae bacterium]|nr:glycoside hydrolase family 31 protein [Lachnospiraceae bacterium]